MSRYLVVCDIADDHRRMRLAKILKRFGDRIQKSVFEVWLDRDELGQLRRLTGSVVSRTDFVEIIPIDLAPSRTRWRWGSQAENFDAVQLGK